MTADQVQRFREYLANHSDYREARHDFHEAYELLEGYWRGRFARRGYETFCDTFGEYYWSLREIWHLARELASEGPIGNSRDARFRPKDEVVDATMFLLHQAGVVPNDTRQDCEEAVCSFKALMIMVTQVRNNLFHGRKLELDDYQLHRNICLVTIARNITVTLLDHLQEAEEAAGLC
jgi:hypothetical protein